ncbi:hypothetical protein C8J33_103232 [Rhizobium sp. PP-CC-3G-465]|nr:hypothetical protein C8J33_103232 [Rhizobium sp. PP-CC-3G-465]
MAKPKTARFGKFVVMLGTRVTTPVYSAPCGFNSKSLALSKDLSEIVVPDCDDPDTASWVGRHVTSMSDAVTGVARVSGVSIELHYARSR